jgi:hypothetical protein
MQLIVKFKTPNNAHKNDYNINNHFVWIFFVYIYVDQLQYPHFIIQKLQYPFSNI